MKKEHLYFLLIALTIILFISKLFSLITTSIPFTELDSVGNIHYYEVLLRKEGNPVTSDLLLQQDQGFIINRTYGTYGVPAGFIKLLKDDFDFQTPFIVILIFLVILSLIVYNLYGKGLAGIIALAITLLSIRSYYSFLWGQWSFIISMIFSLCSVFFYKRFLKNDNYVDLIFLVISLFVSIQVHQLASIIGLTGIISLLINNRKRVKETFYALIIVFLTQLPFISYYLEILNFHQGGVDGFNPIEGFLMNNTYHYPEWFYHNYLIIWGISLLLIPLGFIYGFKKKNYSLILWFTMIFILSRPGFMPLTQVQLRFAIALPVIGSMISGNGFKLLSGLFKNKKIIFLIIFFLILINYQLNAPVVDGLPDYAVDLFYWLRSNLNNSYLTTGFEVPQKFYWWATIISNNTFFTPQVINGELTISNYTDLKGVYNLTHLVLVSGTQVPNEIVLYDNSYLMVVSI